MVSLIYPPSGNNTIDYARPSDVIHIIDYERYPNGIVATIDDVGGTVDKGAYGTDSIIGLAQVLQDRGGGGGLGFQLYGTPHDDVFNISIQDNQWMRVRGRAGDDTFNLNGDRVYLDYQGTDHGIHIDLSQGRAFDDGYGDVDIISGRFGYLVGSEHADTIIGSNNSTGFERFDGSGGNDTIDGGGGVDVLLLTSSWYGPVRVDLVEDVATGTWRGSAFTYTVRNIETIVGSSHNDVLLGSRSDDGDLIWGWGGDDLIYGRSGNDTIHGDAIGISTNDGNDTLFGNYGLDLLEGGAGNDVLWGGQNAGEPDATGKRREGVETVDGGAGDDWVFGNFGNDILIGGTGHDSLWGGQDHDTLDGGAGNDTVIGNKGNDHMTGGEGADWFFGHGGGMDVVADFNPGEGDMLMLPNPVTATSTSAAGNLVIHYIGGKDRDGEVITDIPGSMELVGIAPSSWAPDDWVMIV